MPFIGAMAASAQPAYWISFPPRASNGRRSGFVELTTGPTFASAGLTQAQLATRIGTSQPTIARLEKGLDVRTPRWDTLQRIARALGRQLKLKFAAPSDDDELVEVEQPFRLHRKKGEAATAAAASRTHRSGGSPRRA